MIKVCIKGQKITDFSSPQIVADSIDYITAAFIFQASNWDSLTKYAHFSNGTESYDIELINDVISADKHLNFTAGEWTLWVHGSIDENGELKQRITTDEVTFYVKPTGTTETGNPFPSAVPSMTEQILAEIGELDELETADKRTIVDAINEVFRTAGGEISPELIAEAVKKYLENNPIGEEKDPTVPQWAKQPNKPTYTAQEVGALPDTTEIPSLKGYATEQFVKDEIDKIELPESGGSGVTDHADLTGRDKSDQHPIGAITGLEDQMFRPGVNLLHNADWAYSLVNQRSHSGAVSDAYCIDRWIGNGSVTPVAGKYVTLATNTTMTQRMEIIPDVLVGKECTFSIDVEGIVESVNITFPTTINGVVNTVTLSNCTVELGFLVDNFTLCGVTCTALPYIKITTTLAINVRRVFLEFGTVSHMAETPPEEYYKTLLMCYRYFVRYGNGGASMFQRAALCSIDEIRSFLQLPTIMRVVPTITGNGIVVTSLSGIEQSGFIFQYGATSSPTQISVIATKNDHGLTDGLFKFIYNSFLDFSSDL